MTADQTVVEHVLAGALALLTEKPDATLDDLAAKVASAAEQPLHAETKPFPRLPEHTELTAEAQRALRQLPAIFGWTEIKDRRSLTKEELDKLTLEETVIALVATTLKARDEAIRETIRVHMDVTAEETGIAIPKAKLGPDGAVIVPATPRDQNGHYLLALPQDPNQVHVGPVIWSQEYSAPAPKPSESVLETLHKAGEIDRNDYNAVTVATRRLDVDKLRIFIRRYPERGLRLLRQITVTGTPKASLYLRKQS